MMDWLLAPFRRLRHAIGTVLRKRLKISTRSRPPDTAFARFQHSYEVAVYYPDGRQNLYQLRQWLAPLEQLNESHSVLLVTRSHPVFQDLREMTTLPVVFTRRVGDLDDLVADGDFKVAMYVNHSRLNFQMLRYAEMFHIHIGHGESEKASMASHQIRAYDYAYVAGERAVERYRGALLELDENLRSRMIMIGRPQLDVVSDLSGEDDGPPIVLFAPTWEGDRPTMRYSSVGELGVGLVREILRSGRYRLVYRPHPRTGAYEAGVRDADMEIREMIELSAEAGHAVDTESELLAQIRASAIGIADVSAVTLDYLSTGKPIIVTQVADHLITEQESRDLLDACYRYAGESADMGIVGLLDSIQSSDSGLEAREKLAEEYFGDLTPGASMKRFLEATELLIDRRDELIGEQLSS